MLHLWLDLLLLLLTIHPLVEILVLRHHQLLSHASTDKPGLHIIYQHYIAANEINKQVSKMHQERSWKCKEVPVRTDVINLFVAKTTWHAFYATRIPAAE